jgi:hypothetical protein
MSEVSLYEHVAEFLFHLLSVTIVDKEAAA